MQFGLPNVVKWIKIPLGCIIWNLIFGLLEPRKNYRLVFGVLEMLDGQWSNKWLREKLRMINTIVINGKNRQKYWSCNSLKVCSLGFELYVKKKCSWKLQHDESWMVFHHMALFFGDD